MPKRDSASKRLRDLIEFRSRCNSLWAGLWGESAEPFPGDDPEMWHRAASRALDIEFDPNPQQY